MSDKYGYIGIETLLNFCSHDKNHCVTPNDFMRMNRVKIDERPHGEWIPCSERLPDERGYYLVTTDGSHNHVIDIAEYGFDWRGNDFVMGWNKASRILAWMPLPEPYKEEGEEK